MPKIMNEPHPNDGKTLAEVYWCARCKAVSDSFPWEQLSLSTQEATALGVEAVKAEVLRYNPPNRVNSALLEAAEPFLARDLDWDMMHKPSSMEALQDRRKKLQVAVDQAKFAPRTISTGANSHPPPSRPSLRTKPPLKRGSARQDWKKPTQKRNRHGSPH